MPDPTCPVCGQPAARREPGKRTAFPFCSDRCRQVDLGRWFTGRYAVPAEEEEPGDADDEIPSSAPGGQG